MWSVHGIILGAFMALTLCGAAKRAIPHSMPKREHVEVDGRELALSNLNKVFFPENGFTKGEVIAFYSEIAATIVPHLRDRPLTLKRYPDGIEGEHFYEKNAPSHTPSWVKRHAVPRSEGGGHIHYILCNDKPTLVWATNLGDIEKHVLLARAPHIDCPTSLVFDLDPGEPASILDCCRVALHLNEVFESLGLKCFAKVSGSKGLHLAVPLNTKTTYEVTQSFAKTIAELGERQLPDRVVSDMSKELRRGKVLIDWSQNSDFKTTVAVYAMRAKHGGPFISMPVTWDELSRAVKRGSDKDLFFTPAAAVKRIKRLGDLFEPVLSLKQEIPKGVYGGNRSRPEAAVVVLAAKAGKNRRQEHPRVRSQARPCPHARAGRLNCCRKQKEPLPAVRYSEASGPSSSLRPSAGDGGRASFVGSPERAANEAPGGKAGHARRRPSSRIRGFRGNHPAG